MMKAARFSLPRPDFTAKIAIWGSFCILVFFAATVFAWIQVGEQGLQGTHRDMDASLKSFQLRLDERAVDLEGLEKWLTGQPGFIGMLVSRQSASLAEYLEELVKAGVADSLTVTDGEGQVLARVSRGQPPASGESIMAEPGIRDGLSGRTSRAISKDEFDNVVQSLVFPVRDREQNPPIGALRLGIYLDDGFLSRASTAAAATRLSYYYANESTVILFGDSQRKPFLTKAVPPDALTSLRQGRPSEYLTLDTVEGPYLFKFSPFTSFDPNLSAAYGVGLPLADVGAGYTGPLGVIEIATCALAALTCLAVYMLYRRYAVPLRTLGLAAQRMEEGDLRAGKLIGDDDLDGLGRHINRMCERLRESVASMTHEESRKEAIIRSLGAAVIITNDRNEIVEWNPATESLLDGSKEDLAGQDWREIFAESKRPDEGTGVFIDSRTAGSLCGEFASARHGRYSLRRNPRVILDVISKPLDLDGRADGYVHILEDASEQEGFARARDEFMMNAAHELRSPLSGLRSSVECLYEDHLILSRQELTIMIRNMHRSVIRFEAFVENLIDMGNIMAGRFMVRPVPCLLDEIVDAALGQVAARLEAKGQSVKVETNCAAPCRVFADPSRVTQVVVNLLSNAGKYGPENEAIVLWICDGDRFVNLDVSDRGKGIPSEEQARLFQRFYRGKRGAVEGTGLGLGLALAKEIVEAHGGQIGIRSQEGEGTTFWFSLLKAL
jgi:two-component system, NtrC family, sensor histidine kinase KinB